MFYTLTPQVIDMIFDIRAVFFPEGDWRILKKIAVSFFAFFQCLFKKAPLCHIPDYAYHGYRLAFAVFDQRGVQPDGKFQAVPVFYHEFPDPASMFFYTGYDYIRRKILVHIHLADMFSPELLARKAIHPFHRFVGIYDIAV